MLESVRRGIAHTGVASTVALFAACVPAARVPRPTCDGSICPPPVDWRREAQKECQEGEGKACRTLGKMLFHAIGGPEDPAGAREVFARGCDDYEDAESCFNLAVMWQSGYGGPRDADRAMQLYSESCQQGYAKSCSYLPVDGPNVASGPGRADRAPLRGNASGSTRSSFGGAQAGAAACGPCAGKR
jgi:hypothetical protein